MNRQEVAALLAYAVRLAPRTAPADQAAADEVLDQWADLLSDVPATAPHPTGRTWDAAQVVRHHIATSPYPIQPSDVSRPWHAFRRDVIDRHHDPVPAVDPDAPELYAAELYARRQAVALGLAAPAPLRELTGGTREERDAAARTRLKQLGGYMPRTVAAQLAAYRPHRAERERLAAAGLPDALDVACTWCGAEPAEPCHSRSVAPHDGPIRQRPRTRPHPCRVDAAVLAHAHRQEQTP
ncbi:zinc finger domain-containing protein [Streptomyces sp. CH6]|uniref:zinc finger domain-containing protein n=1 Tax=unclassified Streptomyces TaxID=2593676 RepID=UPI003CFF91CB